ncbi:MAG: succinylglutamate desuccinylase/aspartoacylase family protein [Candidatus Niyogibacteria bacterium]|nr:MAG: succinylglutamate desuccinylase/aspartoacylase family protein [Candidatus Niyogibacteria bacterium]
MKDKNQRIKYGFKKILTGSDLSLRKLAIMEIDSGIAGPTVWITAAVHGDEVGGAAVIHEVVKSVRQKPLLKGALKAMPIMNPIGFEASTRNISVIEEDLNRSFPGDKNGRLSERMAETIFSTITSTKPQLVLDLHNDWNKSVPYLLIDPYPGKEFKTTHYIARRLAFTSGFLMIQEEDESDSFKTLSGSMIKAGIPALTLELGESYVVNEKNVRDGVSAIWRILSELEMVKPDPALELFFKPPKEFLNKALSYYDGPKSQTSGLVRYFTRPGEIIRTGETIAKIYNVFGKLQETAVAEKDGIVLGYPDTAVSFPGAPLAAFGVL